ncbi:MAG: hypothetical protein JJD98_00065 [Polaromonas sp.]|nr:hypothetical protein [Polaromonas sp.]
MALLSPRLWLALALAAVLAFTHVFAYKSGRAAVRAAWDADIAQRSVQALQASEQARATESILQEKNRKVTHDYLAEKKRGAAAAIVSAGRLRDLQAALDSAASADTAPLGGADDPRGRIAGECAAALGILDGYAKDVAAKATALQDYARSVRVTN